MDTKEIARLIANAESQLEKLDAEREKITAELEELRHKQNLELQVRESTSLFLHASITKDSYSAEKIALYRSLFRGREDIYARRWESSRSGKAGYQPACRNEWIKGICRKPEIKCGECAARDFLPVAESVIRNHLKGVDTEDSHHSISGREFVVGIYPLLSENTCYFLAADFDKESWKEDISSFKEVCKEYSISVAMERSRSGIGAHAWIFFSEPIPALMARRFGSFLLTEILDKRPEVGFDSYDRLFPSQDFLPEGGFGSLIALPLQAKPRKKGNTVFLDESFNPYLDQWRIQLAEFLNLEFDKIGMIGAGKRQPTGFIDIAIIQSLRRKGEVDDIVSNYGQVIIDECHHISANSFEQVARKCHAKYVIGLSATVTRKDGHHPIIFMQCGPTRFRVTARQGVATHPFSHQVIFHETGFSMPQRFKDRDPTIHEIYEALVRDDTRNHRIFEDVVRSIAKEKRSPLIISERREHVEVFAEKFLPFMKNVIVFKGGMGRKQRQALNEQLKCIPDKEERLLIATGRYLGEGFDDARLDTLFLALPVSWRGTLAQYAGRLHRLHYNKKEVRIYDYTDREVPLLEKMYKRRIRGYCSIGYSIS